MPTQLTPSSDLVLDVRAVSKRYGHVNALTEVSMQVGQGEIVALVGDNGAGKSTLTKIISGAVTPDEGQIIVEGNPHEFKSPHDATTAGIESVYQDLAMPGNLDIVANLFLGREEMYAGSLDEPAMESRTAKLLKSLDVKIHNLRLPVASLSGGQKQAVAVARARMRDELSHAELSARVYSAAGGSGAPSLARDSLALTLGSATPLEYEVLRVGVEMFCLGETVAVRLFKRLRDASTVPVARTALDKILHDEVSHREFGWTLLAWLLSTPLGPTFRQTLHAELPAMLARVRANYGGLVLDKLGHERLTRLAAEFSADARAWGVMPTSDYVAAVDEAFARDYAPRFAELGIAMPV